MSSGTAAGVTEVTQMEIAVVNMRRAPAQHAQHKNYLRLVTRRHGREAEQRHRDGKLREVVETRFTVIAASCR